MSSLKYSVLEIIVSELGLIIIYLDYLASYLAQHTHNNILHDLMTMYTGPSERLQVYIIHWFIIIKGDTLFPANTSSVSTGR